jgi:hypothetical protein
MTAFSRLRNPASPSISKIRGMSTPELSGQLAPDGGFSGPHRAGQKQTARRFHAGQVCQKAAVLTSVSMDA